MSGEFLRGDTPATNAADAVARVDTKEGGFDTDVADVKAPEMKNGMPVFEVPDDEFYNNLKKDRRSLRFKDEESAVSKYVKTSKVNRPFYIRTSDNKMRKIDR